VKRILGFVVAIALLGGAALIQARHDKATRYFRARQVSVTLPKAPVLKVMSLGFHDALAELIFLWSIQFYSTTYYTNRWDSIEAVFDSIIGISPDNPDYYLTGSLMMGREANRVHAALKLLERGAEHFKTDYIYEYWAGYFSATILKDYALAAQYHGKAAKRENALPGIMNLHAHYIYMQDDLDNAWKLFSELKRTSPHDSIRKSADRHLYDIRYEWDQKAFSELAEKFRLRYNRLPNSLQELVSRGFISAPPIDHQGTVYGYDPQTGQLIPNQKSGWKKRS
jgi:hypothetical protein